MAKDEQEEKSIRRHTRQCELPLSDLNKWYAVIQDAHLWLWMTNCVCNQLEI